MMQPMHAAHSQEIWIPIGVTNSHSPMLCRFQRFLMSELRREGLAATSDRFLDPRVTLHPDRK